MPSGEEKDEDEISPVFDNDSNRVDERMVKWFTLEEMKDLNGEDGLLGVEPIELMQHIKKG